MPLGTLVEVMVCNRLLNPKAQYKIGEWANSAGVCDFYGVSSGQLNDDRLGRALERIALHAFSAQSQLVMHLVKTFKLSVSQIHYDISSVELYGDYGRQMQETAENPPEQDASPSTAEVADARKKQGPQPMYGRTKSGRKNVKQCSSGSTSRVMVPCRLLYFRSTEMKPK